MLFNDLIFCRENDNMTESQNNNDTNGRGHRPHYISLKKIHPSQHSVFDLRAFTLSSTHINPTRAMQIVIPGMQREAMGG